MNDEAKLRIPEKLAVLVCQHCYNIGCKLGEYDKKSGFTAVVCVTCGKQVDWLDMGHPEQQP
jgi:RNase P subunit RPR2